MLAAPNSYQFFSRAPSQYAIVAPPPILVIVFLCLLTLGCEQTKTPKLVIAPQFQSKEEALKLPFYQELSLPPFLADETTRFVQDLPIQNTTNDDVRFTKLNHSCACVNTTLSPMLIPKGERANLHYEIALHGRTGPQRFVVDLVKDDQTRWTRDFVTTIYRRLEITPPELYLGRLAPSDRVSRELKVTMHEKTREQLPILEGFDGLPVGFSIKIVTEQTKELADGFARREYLCELAVECDKIIAESRLVLKTKTRNGREPTASQWLTVTWTNNSGYEIAPSRVVFLHKDNENEKTSKLMVRSTNGKPFSIVKLNCGDEVFQAECITRDARETHVIQVTSKPGKRPFTASYVEVVTDGLPQFRFPVTCMCATKISQVNTAPTGGDGHVD